MAAFDDFQTYLASAQTSFAANDFKAARRYVTLARMSLAQIPNTTSDGTSAQWREELEKISQAIIAEDAMSNPSVTDYHEFLKG